MKKATKSKSQTRRVTVQKKAVKKRAPRADNVDKNLNAGAYVGELDINGQLYTASGDTSIAAFQNTVEQVPKAGLLMRRATLTLRLGDKESSTVFMALQLRRFLNSFNSIQVFAKRLETTLR